MDRIFTVVNAAAVALLMVFSADSYAVPVMGRNYKSVRDFLFQLNASYPQSVSLFSLGVSDSGEEILGAKIGDGPVHNLVVSTHHGNEYGSTELAIAFAESIAREPMAGQSVYVIPVLNIRGYDSRSRQELDANGIARDPNRDYPGPCGTAGPFNLKSTKALADFIEREGIVVSATLHTNYPAVVYPWGFSTLDLDTAYPEIFGRLVTDATVESRYTTGNSASVIYPADGCFEDYAFWKLGVWSLLFELGHTHWPSISDMLTINEGNVPGLRRMLSQAPTVRAANHGFSGRCDSRLRELDRHDE